MPRHGPKDRSITRPGLSEDPSWDAEYVIRLFGSRPAHVCRGPPARLSRRATGNHPTHKAPKSHVKEWRKTGGFL